MEDLIDVDTAVEQEVIEQATIELVTPEIAETFLVHNIHNRPLTPGHVNFLAEQMRAGVWEMTYDPIRFGESGRLMDGQHRLTAIVKSGIAQKLLIIRNLPDKLFRVLDTGKNRSAADVLSIAGHANNRNVAGLVRMILSYEQGRMYSVLESTGRAHRGAIPHGEILDYVENHDVVKYYNKGSVWYRDCQFCRPTEWAFYYWLFGKIDEEQALAFLQSIASGLNLQEESPEYVLRKKLEKYKVQNIRSSPVERLALVIKAWNKHRAGETVGYLLYNPDKEGFPRPE
ncbi:hypothetical protein IC229_27610 [Spirosoma sp. BT702]|uniref:Uncharacterized protein n=1 Tax=Spirosoma profusum TaxID=2771354 RepID=A0A926Y0P4_9BACT|nr:hypothetical protein [Spirosoma profusum]MBD2704439.1 hypothetical protein [Spirosoma profusum]